MVHEDYKEMLAPHALDALDTTDARTFVSEGCLGAGDFNTVEGVGISTAYVVKSWAGCDSACRGTC